MTIVLSPQTEARLLEMARTEGRDSSSLANQIIASTLNLEEKAVLSEKCSNDAEQTDCSVNSNRSATENPLVELFAKYKGDFWDEVLVEVERSRLSEATISPEASGVK